MPTPLATLLDPTGPAWMLGSVLSPEGLLKALGSFATIGLIAIVFAESGLLIGFFLPGDSLLFTAGLVCAGGLEQVHLNLAVILVGCFVAAVAGDQVGYAFGKRVGPGLFNRPDSRIFKQQYVAQADAFFERHGSRAIVLARFVPVVRTFTPILAGVGKMRYRQFVTYNVIGGFVWAVGVIMLGYWLGNVLASLQQYPDRVVDARNLTKDYAAVTRAELQQLALRYFDGTTSHSFVALPPANR